MQVVQVPSGVWYFNLVGVAFLGDEKTPTNGTLLLLHPPVNTDTLLAQHPFTLCLFFLQLMYLQVFLV